MARVLVVDDSKVILSVVQTYLMALEVDFEVAATASEGLSCFQAQPADIVVVDYRLEGMDGTELVRQFRKLARSQIKAVVISSSKDWRVVEALDRGEVDAFLPKPLDGGELKTLVASLLLQLSESQPGRLSLIPSGKRRVVLADDTDVGRRLITRCLSQDPSFEIVAAVKDAPSLLEAVSRERPDLALVDALLPGLSSSELTRSILSTTGARVVLLTELFSPRGIAAAFDAVAEGALDAVPRPTWSEQDGPVGRRFSAHLLRLASLDPVTGAGNSVLRITPPGGASRAPAEVVVVVGSVGGPAALATILPALVPCLTDVPLVIAQALSPGFTAIFGEWLAHRIGRRVSIAFDGMSLEPGAIVLCPDDQHLSFMARGKLHVSHKPEQIPKPSADILLRSAGEHYGAGALGVVLSGLGTAGLDGAAHLTARGGVIVVESPGCCPADDLPQAVLERSLAEAALPPKELASEIARRLPPP